MHDSLVRKFDATGAVRSRLKQHSLSAAGHPASCKDVAVDLHGCMLQARWMHMRRARPTWPRRCRTCARRRSLLNVATRELEAMVLQIRGQLGAGPAGALKPSPVVQPHLMHASMAHRWLQDAV